MLLRLIPHPAEALRGFGGTRSVDQLPQVRRHDRFLAALVGLAFAPYWAFVIFITVIGGIGRLEGPIVGTLLFFLLRQTFADLGSLYLLVLGAIAIVLMLVAPKGLWGLVANRLGWQMFPLARRVMMPGRG